MNRELPGFEQAIQCVVGVVVVVACGALLDQTAGGVADQLGAQRAGCLCSSGARFRGISPEGRRFLKSEERQAMLREPVGWTKGKS